MWGCPRRGRGEEESCWPGLRPGLGPELGPRWVPWLEVPALGVGLCGLPGLGKADLSGVSGVHVEALLLLRARGLAVPQRSSGSPTGRNEQCKKNDTV